MDVCFQDNVADVFATSVSIFLAELTWRETHVFERCNRYLFLLLVSVSLLAMRLVLYSDLLCVWNILCYYNDYMQ